MAPRYVLLLLLLLATQSVPSAAAPLKPDFSLCRTFNGTDINCCTLPDLMRKSGPAPYVEWRDYLRDNPLPAQPRLRRAAHLPQAAHNATYLEQLNRAYQLMRALPRDDPRSLAQQNNFHCMYGGVDVERQLGRPDLDYNIHINWLWLPFHRWFTFFFERILAKLVDDDQFALPFWNWDNQSPLEPILPNVMPLFYRDPDNYPALYDAARDPRHEPGRPPLMADLLTNPLFYPDRVTPDDPQQLRDENNAQLHRYLLASPLAGDVSDQEQFMSYPARLGDQIPTSGGGFESRVHISIHFWLADSARNWEDMGAGYAAVGDPIFFAHHANVDRMWVVWEAMGHQNFNHSDFLDTEFFFYNENAQLVRVTVADCLDLQDLKYTYQEVDNPWVSYRPGPVATATATSHAQASAR